MAKGAAAGGAAGAAGTGAGAAGAGASAAGTAGAGAGTFANVAAGGGSTAGQVAGLAAPSLAEQALALFAPDQGSQLAQGATGISKAAGAGAESINPAFGSIMRDLLSNRTPQWGNAGRALLQQQLSQALTGGGTVRPLQIAPLQDVRRLQPVSPYGHASQGFLGSL